jgi:hypothetical protein
MASIQEMLIGDVPEETEEKIDIEHGFPHLTAKSGSYEVMKRRRSRWEFFKL